MVVGDMHPGQVNLTAQQVAAAIAVQLPELSGHPVRQVPSAGTVVAPFRVGTTLLARVPLVPGAGADDRKRLAAEARNARFLRDRLPVRVPLQVAVGEPFEGYPGIWSLWEWVEGSSLDREPGIDQHLLADDLAGLLRAVHRLPTEGGDWNGVGRGSRPLADTEWVRMSIDRARHLFDGDALTAVWERALAAPPHAGPAVRIHGDPVPGNLIVRDGRLTGLVDIAEPSFGDPAADLVPAWTTFDEPARGRFRALLDLDDAAWGRGRGWALEMAVGALHYYEHTNRVFFQQAYDTIRRLLAADS